MIQSDFHLIYMIQSESVAYLGLSRISWCLGLAATAHLLTSNSLGITAIFSALIYQSEMQYWKNCSSFHEHLFPRSVRSQLHSYSLTELLAPVSSPDFQVLLQIFRLANTVYLIGTSCYLLHPIVIMGAFFSRKQESLHFNK